MSKLEKAGDIFKQMIEEKDTPNISKQKQRLVESLVDAREADRKKNQELMYNSRPFVLCALPVKRPPKGTLLHERRNGKFVLQVVGHPKYGLPFGQDRLIPIWITTLAVRQQSRRVTFRSAAEMLDMFGLPKGGFAYRRLVEGFRRVYGATIFYGTDTERQPAEPVYEGYRFNFFDRIKIWRTKPGDAKQPLPRADDPGNVIEISEAFWGSCRNTPFPLRPPTSACWPLRPRSSIFISGWYGAANGSAAGEYPPDGRRRADGATGDFGEDQGVRIPAAGEALAAANQAGGHLAGMPGRALGGRQLPGDRSQGSDRPAQAGLKPRFPQMACGNQKFSTLFFPCFSGEIRLRYVVLSMPIRCSFHGHIFASGLKSMANCDFLSPL